jgi:hypothetical protein
LRGSARLCATGNTHSQYKCTHASELVVAMTLAERF